jgi:hypothetical protein
MEIQMDLDSTNGRMAPFTVASSSMEKSRAQASGRRINLILTALNIKENTIKI